MTDEKDKKPYRVALRWTNTKGWPPEVGTELRVYWGDKGRGIAYVLKVDPIDRPA